MPNYEQKLLLVPLQQQANLLTTRVQTAHLFIPAFEFHISISFTQFLIYWLKKFQMHVDIMCLLKNHSLQDGFIRTWLHLCPTSVKLLNMMCTTFYHNNAHIHMEKPFSKHDSRGLQLSLVFLDFSLNCFYVMVTWH